MKQLCVLFFLSTAVSGCVVQEGYYANEGPYYAPPTVVVENPEPVNQRYYNYRHRRQVQPNVHGHRSVQAPSSNVHGHASSNVHGHGDNHAMDPSESNVHGHASDATPRYNVHRHPSARTNTSEIVVSSP